MNILFRLYRALLIIALGVSGLTASLYAQQTTESLDQLFTIRGIKVDETASQASLAQQKALAKAETEAFDKLMLKITQPEGRALLPELGAEQKQLLISGLEIVEEQSNSRRYTATINVRFEPSVVSSLLAEYNIPHVLSAGGDILVMHSHGDGLSTFLWKPKKEMLEAISRVDWINRVRTYHFPKGSLQERALVSYNDINSLEIDKSEKLRDLYEVPSALFINSEWRAINKHHGILKYSYILSDNGLPEEGVLDHVSELPDQAEAEALEIMFEQLLDQIDSVWRSKLLVDTGEGGEMSVIVAADKLEDLISIENKLAEVSLVHNVMLKEIGLPFSHVSFQFTGKEEQLREALLFVGLGIEQYGNDLLLKPQE